MSTLITPALQLSRQSRSREAVRFHLLMAIICGIAVCVSVIGSRLTATHYPGVGGSIIGLVVILVVLMPIPMYFHEKGRETQRDCALMIPWTLVLGTALPFPVLVAARMGMPLRDSLYANADQFFGVSVPAIMAWASHHPLGRATLNRSYDLLRPMMLAAVILPALAGKLNALKEFLIANIVTITTAIVIFACLPGVGPWFYYHFPGNPAQHECELQLLALRRSGPYAVINDGAGFICFPSYHVAAAILSAAALWALRPLRVPAAILAVLITISTLTTGWHYFVDVLGGIVVAGVSIAVAKTYTRVAANRMGRHDQALGRL